MDSNTIVHSASMFHGFTSLLDVTYLTTNLALLLNDLQTCGCSAYHTSAMDDCLTIASDLDWSIWLQNLSGLLLRLSPQTDWLVFQFSIYSPCTDPTENTIPLLMQVIWYHVFHCSGTVCVAPDHAGTPLPTTLISLRDITSVTEMMCLSSHSLGTAFSLAPLFHLSSIVLQYIGQIFSLFYWFLCCEYVHFYISNGFW
jgi:hypothetical protein